MAELVLLILIVVGLTIVYLRDDMRKKEAAELLKLERDRGLLNRHSPMLIQLNIVANDVYVLRQSVKSAEVTATLRGCKTYIMLEQRSFPKSRLSVELAVVTSKGTRKRTINFSEPVNSMAMLQDILIEVGKLIDGV